jgi:hypothetical protein
MALKPVQLGLKAAVGGETSNTSSFTDVNQRFAQAQGPAHRGATTCISWQKWPPVNSGAIINRG